ncbi:anoctamin-1 [Halyomorpha halys]|uniref:anoctamin-1 n=1 Tax=Halyomorpha halys TaxID=286706 RepID=UPI0006D4DA06
MEINSSPTREKMNSNSVTVESVYNAAEGTVTSIISEGQDLRLKSSYPARGKTTFHDGTRTVDFILVWDTEYSSCMEAESLQKRKVFEDNLKMEGLELEYEPVSVGSTLNFIKINAPIEVLRRYSEILKLRLPMKKELCVVHDHSSKTSLLESNYYREDKYDADPIKHDHGISDVFHKASNSIMEKFIYVDKNIFPDRRHRFTAIYSRDKEYLFDILSPNFFTQAVRSRIVQFILDRTFFGEPTSSDMFVFGIERLLSDVVYTAAYPLHDGDLYTEGTMRHTLLTEWASVNKWYRYQPVDYVREYFGVKIGLYFTWLGFYTHMLFPASIVGLVCFIFSWSTLDENQPSHDICDGKLNVKMCPLCDKFCDYWDLEDTCFHSKITYLFDNYTTVFFAVFMSVWAVTFLELWKRYSAEMTHRWDLTGFDCQEEQPRPQYLARVERLKTRSKPKINVITGVIERKVPFWTIRFPATILSFSIVLLLVTLALAAVLGVVLYRMSVLAALSVYGGIDISSYAIIFTTTTAAIINLVCIVIFHWMYSWLAEYLTELEMHRTQTEFDDSLTLKMYLLEFINYYASIFYIAFCKGKLVGYPAKYNRLFGYRQEECGPGGCLLELCIQLSIIMVGKQAMNTILEMVQPMVYKWWKKRTIKRKRSEGKKMPQWEKDYELVEWGHHALFPEYLEMVLQYGFVTIFVSAFPLAPLFALVNNILEMRLDAKKLLMYHRRPVAQRVRNIGIWFRILDSISKLAVVTNGFIIAFTSDFIPRLVYILTVSEDRSLAGFLNDSLAIMNTTDLDLDHPPFPSIPLCRYPDYREPPWSPDKYMKTNMYWRVLAARLTFVVIFENIVVMVVVFVGWCIPDVPTRLKEQIRREAFITNEIIIHQEAIRTRNSRFENSEQDQRNSDDGHNVVFQPPKKKWNKDFSVKPQDEALVHRPSAYGEIFEDTV